jgi:YebC/PmpR family DNA-binding regulatory protein
MGRGWVHGIREASSAKKGKLFTKIAKEISVAVRTGGSKDPNSNARLRLALREAQKNSMPKDTVERAIKRGAGETQEGQLDEIVYEAYGAFGIPVLVEVLTDNKNRTVQDLRAIFVRGGGALGEPGSVMWNFDHVCSVLAKDSKNRDAEEAAINVGANEVSSLDEGVFQFIGDKNDLDSIQEGLTKEGWEVLKAEIIYKPKAPAELKPDQEEMLEKLNENLNDHDDVKRVHFAL